MPGPDNREKHYSLKGGHLARKEDAMRRFELEYRTGYYFRALTTPQGMWVTQARQPVFRRDGKR